MSIRRIGSSNINGQQSFNSLFLARSTVTIGPNLDPVWGTSIGSIGNIYDVERSSKTFTLSASDLNLNTLTYSLSGGSLPPNMTLNPSTGVISGTTNSVVSDTTYNFSIELTDGSSIISRSFNIIVKAPIKTIFSYTGGDQVLTVPSDLTIFNSKVWGAGGGYVGGAGGYSTGNVLTNAETSYRIVVGGGGLGRGANAGTGGANYGNGGLAGNAGYGGGGGGVTGIFTNGLTSMTFNSTGQARSLMLAGGGGGGSWDQGQRGGDGGGTNGGNGSQGGGGTQTGGGGGGFENGYQLGGGRAGGGDEGGGGGGGSGYWGAGGGNGNSGFSGGGGSGYIHPTRTINSSMSNGSGGTPPSTGDADYSAGIGVGPSGGTNNNGGNGRIVINY